METADTVIAVFSDHHTAETAVKDFSRRSTAGVHRGLRHARSERGEGTA